MTLSSPARGAARVTARRLLAAGGAFAAAGALSLGAAMPAQADAENPKIGEHYSSARIASVQGFCADNTPEDGNIESAIGNLNTDEDGKEASADFSDAAGGINDERHFPEQPAEAMSSVQATETSLMAKSVVKDLRFSPNCTSSAGANSAAKPMAQLMDSGDLVSLDSLTSTSSWTPEEGAKSSVSVEGLVIFNKKVDLSDGTASGEIPIQGGGTLAYEVTKHSKELKGTGVDYKTTANSWLMINFHGSSNGQEYEQSLELGQSNVHSIKEVTGGGGGEDPSPSPSPTDDDGDESPSPSPSPTDDDGDDKPTPSPTESGGDGGGDDGNGDDGGDDDELPVTGAALGGLVAAAVVAAGGGGAAMYFARKKKAAAAEETESDES